MFIQTLLLVLGILSIALLAMGFNVFFRKNKKFPQSSIGHNKEMRKLGITCARSSEIKCRREVDKKNGEVNCAGCGQA